MAIVVANPFGELRGKLGGFVFSAVKGRKVVRAYSIPVQPRTEAQLVARASFGSAAQAYHGLTDLQKANWESYARGIFNAKDQFNEGQWSGANAFVSLRNLTNMAIIKEIDMLYYDSDAVALDGTAVDFDFDATPPTDQLASNVKGLLTGLNYPMFFSDVVLGETGQFAATIDFLGAPAAGIGQDELVDQSGNPFGLAVYVSNVVNQDHNFVNNPAMQLLAVMPPITGKTLVGLGTSTSITMANETDLDLTKYKSFGVAGDQVQVKVYAISESGMIVCVGVKMTTLQAGS